MKDGWRQTSSSLEESRDRPDEQKDGRDRSNERPDPMFGDNQMKVMILGASLDATNMGVGALAAGAVKCVLAQYPEARVFVLEYAKKRSVHTVRVGGRDVSIPLINIRFSKKFYLFNNIVFLLLLALALKLTPFRKLRNWVVARNSCLLEIQQASLVAAVSGGDSFSDIYGLERLLYVSLPQILVLLLGKKLILLPQTIGPFGKRFSRVIARYIIRHAERVYSRDHRGVRDVEALVGRSGGWGKIAFCYDLGFALEPVPPAALDLVGLSPTEKRAEPLVGFNISGLLYIGGYTRDNMFGLRINYRKFVYDLIEFLIMEKGTSVLLVPHVFGMDAESESDQFVSERIFEELKDRYRGHLGLVRGTYNQSEIKYVISRCDFFIGSRMHACIAAVSQCIPASCVAYSDKFVAVMETLKIDSIVADARRLSEEEILKVVARAYDHSDAIRLQLQERIAKVKASVLDLFKGTLDESTDPASSILARSSSSLFVPGT